MNNLDLILVPSKQEAKSVKASGVTTKCKVVSGALDVDFINKNRDHKLDIHSKIANSFVFYTVGEFVERKNLRCVFRFFKKRFIRSSIRF